MQHVLVKRRIDAPRQAVWDVYTDHLSWPEWSMIGSARLDREGEPAPNGVGCVRVLGSAGVNAYEEVLSFDAPARMTYRLVKGGMPIKDHLGEVTFEDEGEGTLITWRCRFNSKIPGLGFVFRAIITQVFRSTLAGLDRNRFQRA